MIMDPHVLGYYQRGGELTRLRRGRNRLEFWRTRDVLRRVLPPAPARVLDVGGGTGVHADGCAPWPRLAAPSDPAGWSPRPSSAGTRACTTASTTAPCWTTRKGRPTITPSRPG